MGKIYVGQKVEIRLDTDTDLSTATGSVIRAVKPSGTIVCWTGTIDGEEVVYTTNGTPLTDLVAGTTPAPPFDIDESGRWRLQAVPEIDGAAIPGETVTMIVFKMGE